MDGAGGSPQPHMSVSILTVVRLICQAVEKPFSGGSIAACAMILQGCDGNFLPAGAPQASALSLCQGDSRFAFPLVRFPSFLGSDRTNGAVTYPPGSLLPAVSFASSLALYSACTKGDYLPSCSDSPSLSQLRASCFTPSEAAKVSLALPWRRSRSEEDNKSWIVWGWFGLVGFFQSKWCKDLSQPCQPWGMALCPRQQCPDQSLLSTGHVSP